MFRRTLWKRLQRSPKQLKKLVNIPTENRPFEKSLHSVKEGQMARKNSDRTLFQKKENSLQKQPSFTSSYDKHGGINLFSSKQIIFQTKISNMSSSMDDEGISTSLETADKSSCFS